MGYTQQKNQVGIYIGPIHYFFDESPIFGRDTDGYQRLELSSRLNESWGIDYTRRLNDNSSLGIDLSAFSTTYVNNYQVTFDHPVIGSRHWITIGAGYQRIIDLKHNFTFHYGAGVNFRFGREKIILIRTPIGPPELGYFEIISTGGRRNDLGLSAFGGIEYRITNWLYTYTKLDFLGLFYIHDKEYLREMIEYDLPQFPSRYNLSLKIGFGVAF